MNSKANFVNAICMNTLLLSIKKSNDYLAYPFIFLSLFLIVVNIIEFLPVAPLHDVYLLSQNNLEFFFGFLCVYFVCYYNHAGKRAITASFCYVLGDSVLFALSGEHFSLVFSVIIAFVFSAIIKNTDILYSFILLMLISVIFALVIGLSYDYLISWLRAFCGFMKNKELLFGVINNAYSIFFSDSFGEMFYSKDYSASTVVNNQIVAGVKEIFIADSSNPIDDVKVFLTGKYFVNIFVSIGALISLYSKTYGKKHFAFALLCAISVLFGDIKLLSLFLLLFNPIIYLAYLFMVFVSYLLPMLLDIKIGFYNNGSVIELFKYGQKWFFFFITGFVIAVMTYFLFQIVISKFDIEKKKLLPKEVKKIVVALGGEKNIERIKMDKLYVKNPNLIDVLKLDCDINGNEITLHYGDLELIKEYF